jgi:hypothetical protein
MGGVGRDANCPAPPIHIFLFGAWIDAKSSAPVTAALCSTRRASPPCRRHGSIRFVCPTPNCLSTPADWLYRNENGAAAKLALRFRRPHVVRVKYARRVLGRGKQTQASMRAASRSAPRPRKALSSVSCIRSSTTVASETRRRKYAGRRADNLTSARSNASWFIWRGYFSDAVARSAS